MWWFRCQQHPTRARLGRVATLDQPRSVYKSNVQCSFLSRNDGQMTLKVKVNDFHFQYQPRVSPDAWLEHIWWFQFETMTSYRVDKVKFTDGRTDAGNDNTPSAWKVMG